jgi:CDP-diacylglycerol--serine O-phosphatidyltransferase
MFYSFAVDGNPVPPGLALGLYLLLIGVLMISRIPTWSFKSTRISRANVKYFLLAAAGVAAALLTVPWSALVALSGAYVVLVLWGLVTGPMRKRA